MTAGIWFWIIYVISLIFGGGWAWRNQGALIAFGPYILIFYVLTGLLGWGIFGAPIR